jgi:hypothetical protein
MRYADLYSRLVSNIEEPESEEGCWLWRLQTDRDGYARINVHRDGKHRKLHAHRLMAEIVLDRRLDPDEETVEHLCTVHRCINPNHFDYVTRAENAALRWSRASGR